MEKVFIDTSGWYSFLNVNDPVYLKIKDFISQNPTSLVTSNFIVAETLNLLVSRRQKHMALSFGKALKENSEIIIYSIEHPDEAEAWKIFQKYKDKDYSYTDCTSFALMNRLKIQAALALDDDFAKMGFTLIPQIK